MKKLIAVNASPHKDGACVKMVAAVCEGAKEAGYEIIQYNLNELNIKGCQGCGYCKQNAADCILKDDLAPYWQQLQEADALVVAAPNYCSLVNGTFLQYMGRHYCLLTPDCRLHPGVKLVGCFAQGRPELNEYVDHYDLILKDFENRDMVRQAMIVYSERLPEEEKAAILANAKEVGRKL